MSTTPPALAADLEAGLRRLRLGAMRRLSPELLVVAKTQRWKPEEFLRTLVEAEIASRDASNARARMAAAAFPVTKTLDEFDVEASSVPRATFDYLASLEWIGAKENLCLVGPAGTGKSHLLVALGHHAVDAGKRVRYFTATELVETLYRGSGRQLGRPGDRADPEGRPDPDRRDRLRPDGRHRRPAVLPHRRRRLRAPVPRHRLALAVRGLGTLPPRAHHGRQPARPAPPPQRPRRHLRGVVPAQGGPPEGRWPEAHLESESQRGVRTSGGQNRGLETGHGQPFGWIDTSRNRAVVLFDRTQVGRLSPPA